MILEDLYQELILDHYKHPRNMGTIEHPDVHKHVKNPFCGDEIDLDIKIDQENQQIQEIRFKGEGCSISQASASMLTELLRGKSLDEAQGLIEIFKKMVRGEATPEEEEKLGDLQAFKGVSKFPVRVKCATLVWNTVNSGLKEINQAAK